MNHLLDNSIKLANVADAHDGFENDIQEPLILDAEAGCTKVSLYDATHDITTFHHAFTVQLRNVPCIYISPYTFSNLEASNDVHDVCASIHFANVELFQDITYCQTVYDVLGFHIVIVFHVTAVFNAESKLAFFHRFGNVQFSLYQYICILAYEDVEKLQLAV